jgi:hypothetical protein
MPAEAIVASLPVFRVCRKAWKSGYTTISVIPARRKRWKLQAESRRQANRNQPKSSRLGLFFFRFVDEDLQFTE